MMQMNGIIGDNEQRQISKAEVAEMPLVNFPGKIVVIDTLPQAEKAVAVLQKANVIGFDTETRPAFRKGQRNKVALLQLSTDDVCFLFRLNIIGFCPSLLALLSSPEVLKIGLSLKDDYMTIRRLSQLEPAGFVELQQFVKKYNIAEASLQKIYAILFGQKISKSQRLSNWEADTLSEGQKKYAAIDAWACLKIYSALLEQ